MRSGCRNQQVCWSCNSFWTRRLRKNSEIYIIANEYPYLYKEVWKKIKSESRSKMEVKKKEKDRIDAIIKYDDSN